MDIMKYPEKEDFYMKKRLLSLLLLLSLLCPFVPALASTPLQDPVDFTYGLVEHLYNYDKDTHLQKHYHVSRDNMQSFINAYVDMLKSDHSLEYLGVTQNGKHIYHCFAPADGYDYDTFSVKSYGVKITPTICLAVQYEENDTKAYIRYSKDFYITDAGLRMDMAVYPTSAPTKVPTSKPTKAPTPTPRITMAPTAVPAPDGTLSGYGYVTTNSVNLRTGPGTNYRALRFMHRYAFAQVLETTYNGSETWYKIVQNGDTGYVMGTYFKLLNTNELTAFLLSDEYLQGIKNNAKATATPRVTATPYFPPVYVPTRAPSYPVVTTPPSGSTQPIYLTIQDPAAYANGQLNYQYSFNGGAYRQNCYRVVYGSAESVVDSFVNTLSAYETTLRYGGAYNSVDGKWTYHYFTSNYAYSTFQVYYDMSPVTPASCLIIGHSDDRVYLYYSPNFSVQDEGARY